MSSRWANGTFVGLCESSSPTTIVNETTKALRTNCSTVRLQNDGAVPCVVVGESVEFSATTTGQPHRPEARSILGQNEARQIRCKGCCRTFVTDQPACSSFDFNA